MTDKTHTPPALLAGLALIFILSGAIKLTITLIELNARSPHLTALGVTLLSGALVLALTLAARAGARAVPAGQVHRAASGTLAVGGGAYLLDFLNLYGFSDAAFVPIQAAVLVSAAAWVVLAGRAGRLALPGEQDRT